MAGNKNTDFKRKYFALPDLLLLAVVLFVAFASILHLFSLGASQGDLKAIIRVSGEVYEEISLSEVKEPYSITVKGDGAEAVLYITSESVEFTNSECFDHLCVNTGALTKSGDSAVCLPLRISAELVAEDVQDENTPDAIVG